MVLKKTITISIDLEDYQELARRDVGISGGIREALAEYLGKPEIKTEKLQKAMEIMQKTILEQQEIIDNLERSKTPFDSKNSLTPFEVNN